MKKSIQTMFLLCIAFALVLLACSPQSQTSPGPANSPLTTPSKTSIRTDYEGLGLTEEEIRMLEERGVASVESAEVASKIAGFKVVTPGYLPDGFNPGKFSITISGAGLPAGMAPKFNNTRVQQVYTREQDKNIIVTLIQSPQKSGIAGSQPVELCGKQAEKAFSKADSSGGQSYDKLTLGWEKEGIYYILTGILDGSLNETEIEKIACSIVNAG